MQIEIANGGALRRTDARGRTAPRKKTRPAGQPMWGSTARLGAHRKGLHGGLL